MRAFLRVLCVFALVSVSSAAFSQQYYSYTGVTRVVKYRIKPGKSAEFYKWLSNAPKILGAEQQAGLIEGFHLLHSTEFIGPDKYDVALVITYKNMAALDESGAKADPVVAKAVLQHVEHQHAHLAPGRSLRIRGEDEGLGVDVEAAHQRDHRNIQRDRLEQRDR